MDSEKEMKKLPNVIWEKGRPSTNKDLDYYSRTIRILEDGKRVFSNVNRFQTRVSQPMHRERIFNCAESRSLERSDPLKI